MTKTAVILFNLGGPDRPESVRPFLFNLFNDPAIIGLPGPLRWLVAQLISRRRAPVAREIYEHLGGKSPLLELTVAQADALQAELSRRDPSAEVRVFIAMRYWHPMSTETASAVKGFDPDEVLLVPLYPQYSTTTTGSSLKEWRRAAAAVGLDAPMRAACCYPIDSGWIAAQAALIGEALEGAEDGGDKAPRVLFSAHGLPKKVVDAGDPYQWQVEQTAQAVVEHMASDDALPTLGDWQVCYQSRVGPLEWIGPSTEEELERAARDDVPVVVVPIAFVSEHSETLVELDIEYREEAVKLGVPGYVRVPAVGTTPAFIAGLADMAENISARDGELTCGLGDGARVCPAVHGRCAMAAE